MSVNSQLLGIVNDIEELNEETTTINGNIETINESITSLETTKHNIIVIRAKRLVERAALRSRPGGVALH